MLIDWVAILNKVPEMAMVIVVIVFALRMTESQRKSAREVMSEWRLFLNRRDESWKEYIIIRDDAFISTLTELKEQQINSTAILVDELKNHSKRIEELSFTLRSHNDDVLRKIEKVGNK